MGLFDKQPMTAIEALDNELDRLNDQMDQFSFDDDKVDSAIMQAYTILMKQRETIQKALVDLAKSSPQGLSSRKVF